MDVPGTSILCLCKEGSTTQSVLFFSTEYQSERAYAEPERCKKEIHDKVIFSLDDVLLLVLPTLLFVQQGIISSKNPPWKAQADVLLLVLPTRGLQGDK